MENARAVIAAYMRERMKADDVASRTVGKAITKALEELPAGPRRNPDLGARSRDVDAVPA